jgi:glucosamine-6-phosphate deaminase
VKFAENGYNPGMRVLVAPDYRTLSRQAADLVTDALRLKSDLVIGLPAGNTPTGMYEELVQRNLDFSDVKSFNVDEYVGLDEKDPRSFRAYMERVFFKHVNVARPHIHFPDDHYEDTIRAAGGIDLLILGIGRNGHIAFNEPGSHFESRTRIVDLAPETAGPVRRGITMGVATILDAKRILLLVSGASKREILKRAIEGPIDEAVPASSLQSHSDVTVIVDAAAIK